MNIEYTNIYNNLIKLTRNKNLYLNLKNKDTFSDRLIILLFHFGFYLKNIYKLKHIRYSFIFSFKLFFITSENTYRAKRT